MNRYEILKEIFFNKIEEKVYGIYKQKAYFHSIQVSTLCMLLAKETNLNQELLGIIGLYHDFAQYINHNHFNHAKLSALALETLLDESFSDEEKRIMTQAIINHSNKEQINDEYSEILKTADLLAKYLEDPDIILKDYELKRIERYR